MSKLIYRAIIENIQNEKCTKLEISALIGVFEKVVKNMANDLEHQSYQDLEDFCDSRKHGISQFTLTLERKIFQEGNNYIGKFKNGYKNLKIIASF